MNFHEMNIDEFPLQTIKDSLHWFPHIHNKDYRFIHSDGTTHPVDMGALVHFALGAAGEVGEVANKIKKLSSYGDAKNTVSLEDIAEECADVLYYIFDIFAVIGVTPSDALTRKHKILEERWGVVP